MKLQTMIEKTKERSNAVVENALSKIFDSDGLDLFAEISGHVKQVSVRTTKISIYWYLSPLGDRMDEEDYKDWYHECKSKIAQAEALVANAVGYSE